MIHVVAGALLRADGHVLIAQRPLGKHLAGGWEFPGGKLEPGESRRNGLMRELREELGVQIHEPRPLMRLRHTYPYGEVCIDMWVISRFDGDPRGLDGQALQWCALDHLDRVDLLPADRPIVRALALPAHLAAPEGSGYVIGGEPADARLRGAFCRELPDARAAVAAGADFLLVSRSLAPAVIEDWTAALPVPLYVLGMGLEQAWRVGATGTHALPIA